MVCEVFCGEPCSARSVHLDHISLYKSNAGALRDQDSASIIRFNPSSKYALGWVNTIRNHPGSSLPKSAPQAMNTFFASILFIMVSSSIIACLAGFTLSS